MDETDTAPAPHQQRRESLARWAQESWGTPAAAISFTWRRFHLAKFSGRHELGTWPLRRRITWIASWVVLPVWFVYGWVRQILDETGITTPRDRRDAPDEPGTISVVGSTDNQNATSLIDQVKRSPRQMWIVFSRTRLAVVAEDDEVPHARAPHVLWRTDPAASVRFHHAARNSIEITWPDGARASFHPTIDERQVVTGFVRETWGDAH